MCVRVVEAGVCEYRHEGPVGRTREGQGSVGQNPTDAAGHDRRRPHQHRTGGQLNFNSEQFSNYSL